MSGPSTVSFRESTNEIRIDLQSLGSHTRVMNCRQEETQLPRDPEDRTVSRDPHEILEKMLDKTLADSFPASDPPSTIPNPSDDSLEPRNAE